MPASYKILSTKHTEDTLYTEIEYTNDLNEVITTVVAHFQPQTKAEVEQSIRNRFASEDQKLSADKRCAMIVDELEIGVKVNL